MKNPKWLKTAIFYEIYPQSYYDSNNDGIGDLNGICQKLDYIKSLGCNAIWLNPIFDSPFKDAGYDVRDYLKIAPRYGTMEDLKNLIKEMHKKDMHLLLDLVPCHTSEEHEWFKKSCLQEKNEYSHRYIWTNSAFEKPRNGLTAVGGEAPRNGTYVISYFNCQPALNYGFAKIDDNYQFSIDSNEARATQHAIIDVIKFYLNLGVDGFRVDMAACLVKNDDQEKATMEVWKYIFNHVKNEFPEAAFVSEWGHPDRALKCGFDMDFYLDHGWDGGNGYHHLLRDNNIDMNTYEFTNDDSYFKTTSNQSIIPFLNEYMPWFEKTKNDGYISFLTDNHDMIRTAHFFNDQEIRIIYAFLLTMPGVPFIYYGDEIGMKYLKVPTKEGGYHRTGSRTPMQWNNDVNLGFSKADKDELYLPIDSDKNAPTVEKQLNNPASLLNHVKKLISLRNQYEDLGNKNQIEIVRISDKDKLFIYKRGEFYLLCNPSNKKFNFDLRGEFEYIYGVNCDEILIDKIIPASSFAIIKKK